MPIDSKNKIMKGIMGHHGDGFEGLNPKLPTPRNYAEYKRSVESLGGNPATEAQLEAGIAKVEADKTARREVQATDEAAILNKLNLTRDDLKALKEAMTRI